MRSIARIKQIIKEAKQYGKEAKEPGDSAYDLAVRDILDSYLIGDIDVFEFMYAYSYMDETIPYEYASKYLQDIQMLPPYREVMSLPAVPPWYDPNDTKAIEEAKSDWIGSAHIQFLEAYTYGELGFADFLERCLCLGLLYHKDFLDVPDKRRREGVNACADDLYAIFEDIPGVPSKPGNKA